MRPRPDKRRLDRRWLAGKLEAPELWSVRDRDDIVYFIEVLRAELARTPEGREPLLTTRAEYIETLEAAMEAYIESR